MIGWHSGSTVASGFFVASTSSCRGPALAFPWAARGAHFGVDAPGRRYTSVELPGTGLSWRESKPVARQCDLCAPGHVHVSPAATIIVLIAGAILLLFLSITNRS